jgi:hypothetical protein
MAEMKRPAPAATGSGAGIQSQRDAAEDTQEPARRQPVHEIPVNPNAVALVDAADAALADEYSWRRGGTGNRYAASFIRDGDSVQTLYLHRLIVGAGHGEIVDHVDGDPLNNRRENLRLVSRSENGANRRETQNQAGFRNVVFSPKRRRYQARVSKQGGVFRGPYRKVAEEAARDADALLRDVHPGVCRLNFPEGDELPIIRRNNAGDGEP